jgi:hypothetical protein
MEKLNLESSAISALFAGSSLRLITNGLNTMISLFVLNAEASRMFIKGKIKSSDLGVQNILIVKHSQNKK